jgi:hypothetical protein
MNAEEILARTFAEHEEQAPDPEAVLADVHARLARRRRTVPVLAAAATVAAIAIGASVLVGQQRPAPGPPASTPSPTATGSNWTPPPNPSPTPPDPLATGSLADAARSTVAVDTTWLPPGTVKDFALGLFYGRQTRTYEVTGSDGSSTHIDLEVRPGSDLKTDDGIDNQPHDVTIGGRPAREFRAGEVYAVVVRLPGNRVAQVGVLPMGGGGTLDVAATGRRVAASLRFDRPEPIKPAYRPTYVPKDLVVRAVDRSDGLGTQWTLAKPDAQPQGPWVAVGQDPRPGTNSTLPQPVVDGRPVQGHPTHVVTEGGGQVALYVDRFVAGQSLTITVTNNLVPVAELYKIADGIRF